MAPSAAMKHLRLLRHAKSSWEDANLADRDRPLNERGIEAATAIATHLHGLSAQPELILCSYARRTRETLSALIIELERSVHIRIEDGLYLADEKVLLDRLQRVPESYLSVLLIGHNPALHELATFISSNKKGERYEKLSEKYPTGALASFEVTAPAWRELGKGSARLVDFVSPGDLL